MRRNSQITINDRIFGILEDRLAVLVAGFAVETHALLRLRSQHLGGKRPACELGWVAVVRHVLGYCMPAVALVARSGVTQQPGRLPRNGWRDMTGSFEMTCRPGRRTSWEQCQHCGLEPTRSRLGQSQSIA